MKTLRMVLAVGAILCFAGSAFAGFDFADSFSVGPGTDSEAIVTINAAGGTYDPVGTADFSDDSSVPFVNAVLDATWSPNAVDANSAGGSPDLMLWFGSISIPSGGLFQLTSVAISEDGSSFTAESFSDSISASSANGFYRIDLDDVAIPPADRDSMVDARFTFTYSRGVTFTVDGVSTPEPTTFALFGLGLAGIGGAAIRRRRRKARES